MRIRIHLGPIGMFGLLPFFVLLSAAPLRAQLSTGTIKGSIHAKQINETATLRINLQEATTSTDIQEVTPDVSGMFTFRNVPFATYNLNVMEEGVRLMTQTITVRSAVPLTVTFDTVRQYTMGEVTVEGQQGDPSAISPGMTTHSLYTAETIAQLPAPVGNKSIESILLNTPGVVPDEDGRLHVRGEDAQLQYVIDGIPITGNLTRVYASLFNATLIKSADVLTGGLSAEYGVAASGIVAVTTKSGFDSPLFAHASGLLGSFDSREGVVEVGGNLSGNTALYLAANATSSQRYLDPLTPGAPNHDDGTSQSFFGKLNTLFGAAMELSVLGMYDQTKFSIPNQFHRVPSQDQRQTVDDYMAGTRLNIQADESTIVSGLLYTRRSRAQITSGGLSRIASPADSQNAVAENERFFIGGMRICTSTGGQIEYSSRQNWFSLPHSLKAGISAEAFPLHEFLTFAITNPALSSPDTVGGDARFLPYDITRGGKPFLVDQSRTGRRLSGFIQDEFREGPWALNVGARFDAFTLVETESSVSPRAAISYSAGDNIAFRASYSRIVMQAPIENYLVSSSLEARTFVGSEQGTVPAMVHSEKAQVLEAGAAYRMNRFLDADLSGYAKFIDDFIVKVELGNSGVIFPVNLKQGLVAGGELRVRLRDFRGFSGSLSLSTCVSRGLVPGDGSSPFAAGLVLGEEGESYSNPFKGEDSFPTEHNQLLTAAFTVTYEHPAGLFATFGGRFDSGLPFDLVGPGGEALDEAQSRDELRRRGYTDEVINLLDLAPETTGSPDRSVAPHAVFDATFGCDFARGLDVPLRLSVTVLNVFDTLYLYKFESHLAERTSGFPEPSSAGLSSPTSTPARRAGTG